MSKVPNPYPGVTVPATTAKPPCNPTYVSINMKAGDTFILPPGAIVVASTAGASVLTSDCADLQVEDFKDYYLRFSVIERDGGSSTSNFERGNISADAMVVNNQQFGFSSACGWNCMNGTGVIDRMNEIYPGLFKYNWHSLKDENSHNAGQTVLISFKTIPSLAKTLYVRWKTGTFWQDGFPDSYHFTKATTNEQGTAFP